MRDGCPEATLLSDEENRVLGENINWTHEMPAEMNAKIPCETLTPGGC
jgi:hypothetical protein